MANKVTRPATLRELDTIKDNLLQGGELCLMKVDHAYVATEDTAAYTADEATFGGYARITVSDWGGAALNASNQAEVAAALKSFVATGAGLPQTIYGVFFLDVNGDLAYVEKFTTGGVVLSSAGDAINYIPKFTAESKY